MSRLLPRPSLMSTTLTFGPSQSPGSVAVLSAGVAEMRLRLSLTAHLKIFVSSLPRRSAENAPWPWLAFAFFLRGAAPGALAFGVLALPPDLDFPEPAALGVVKSPDFLAWLGLDSPLPYIDQATA